MWRRRPLASIAVGMAIGILGGDRMGDTFWIILLFIPAGFLLIGEFRHFCFLLILSMVFGGLLSTLEAGKPRQLPRLEGQLVRVEGLITGVQRGDDFIRIELSVRQLNGGRVTERTLVRIQKGGKQELEDVLVGKSATLEGRVALPGERRNPGTFDYRSYLKTQQVFGLVQEGRILHLSLGPESFYGEILYRTAVIKDKVYRELVKRIPTEYSAMVTGMMFGDTDRLDEKILEQFRKNGTAHILAVSGLHVGMVYASVSMLLPGGKFIREPILLLLLFLYMVMASFSPSVMRAFLMILIHIIGKRLYRRYDLLSSGSFAFILLLLINPYSLFDTGFQLSFLAIASLAFFLPILEKLFKSSLVSMVFALPLGLSPVTAYLFNYGSLSGLLLNPPVVFLSGILIPSSLLLIPLVMIPEAEVLLDFLASFLQLLAEALIWMNQVFFVPGRSYWNICSPPLLLLLLYYIVAFIGLSEGVRWLFRFHRKKWARWSALIVCGLIFLYAILPPSPFQKADAVFVDVGQGDCVHLRTESGKQILIDGGGKKEQDVGRDILLPYLLKNGVRKIDLAVVTHLHTDHFDGIASLAREGMVQKILLYEGYRLLEEDILKQTGLAKEDLIYGHGGMILQVDKSTTLQILNPPSRNQESYGMNLMDQEDENKNSLVLMAEIRGGRILLTGDITKEGEEDLIRNNPGIRPDVLKVAHHGSKSSSGEFFLQSSRPGSAVIQVGKNYYGHPSPEVLERLESMAVPVFRTDRNGAVALRFYPEKNSSSGVGSQFSVLHTSEI